MTKILTIGEPLLYEVADEATFGTDVDEIVQNMWHALHEAGGVGLAAPQIGVSMRIIIVKWQGVSQTILNPEITPRRNFGTKFVREGCLSVPETVARVRRHKRVTVTGYTPGWKPLKLSAGGYLAAVYQHEVDHLNGILIS